MDSSRQSVLSPGYYFNNKLQKPTNCSYFDAAVPGTGPIKMVGPNAPSTDFEKFNSSFDFSLKSKSDHNLNPQPEGNVFGAFPKAEQNRQGIYAIDTDRGELTATAYTQINATGQKQFQNRLQDTVRPTMKETTLYAYDGAIAPINPTQAVYSQYIPEYANINGKSVRINGASNFGLRTATEYSYFSGAAPTGINGAVIQNPDAALGKNTKPVPDFNVDGPGTFEGSRPDGARFQNYRLISQPTSNGLRFNYNLETDGGSVADYSSLLGKNVSGIENRNTASYQIAPLFTNPLHVIWDPNNKGEIPEMFTNTNPVDYAYSNIKDLPPNDYVAGGYNSAWQKDDFKTSSNAYILDMEKGIHNPELEWSQGVNSFSGVVITPETVNQPKPSTGYGGKLPVYEQYLSNVMDKYINNTYTTLGDPTAGYL